MKKKLLFATIILVLLAGVLYYIRLLYRPVYKEVFSPPGVTDEPQNVFHDALLNYQKHYLFF